jgi:site-specific DNA-methyltransferase (adenine-specific)
MNYTLHNGDCLEILRTMPDNSVDAVVTDPPYGLAFMGKKWDYDVPSIEIWQECLRVLKPGGHLLAFAGTRTQHRMAVRIEDAGFEIRDMIAWVYGSGFPKSHDISKAIDKAAGAEREIVRIRTDGNKGGGANTYDDDGYVWHKPFAITAPATPAAKQWEGWGTALKPALEPITVARKPFTGTVAANVLEHGTGALNVDGCRVGVAADDKGGWRPNCYGKNYQYQNEGAFLSEVANGSVGERHTSGRWPANLIHDGSEEVVGMFPEQAGANPNYVTTKYEKDSEHLKKLGASTPFFHETTKGSAARFFYCAKASKADRDEGCEGMGGKIAKVTGMQSDQGMPMRMENGVATGPKAVPKMARNHHPTVKPTDLMRYLCRLVTPPGGIVLDPFTGSGSTGKAAILEGFQFIGIEREAEYLEIARARIEHAIKTKPNTLF